MKNDTKLFIPGDKIIEIINKDGRDQRDLDYVESLLDCHDLYSPSIKRAMGVACKKGDIEIVNLLLKKKVSSNFADEADPEEAPLMIASEAEHFDVVLALLKAGAVPNLKNSNGKTALDIARGKKNKDIIQILQIACARVKHGGALELVRRVFQKTLNKAIRATHLPCNEEILGLESGITEKAVTNDRLDALIAKVDKALTGFSAQNDPEKASSSKLAGKAMLDEFRERKFSASLR